MPHPTLDHIVYDIINLAHGGRSTHNQHPDPRQVAQWVHSWRATFLRRDLSRNRRLREAEQILSELPLVEVQAGPPQILRTVEALPQPLRLRDREAITYAGDAAGLSSFQIVDNHAAQWRPLARFTGGDPFVYLLADGRLYLHGADGQTHLTVRGIFENPARVQARIVALGQAAEADPWRYPLPMDMVEPIVKNIAQTELGLVLSTSLDTQTDTLPDPPAGGGP